MSPDTKFHFESTDKFLHNLDTVLAGRTFHLAMDDGEDFELRFVTGNIVEWRRPGEALRYEEYGCLRADDKVYFVSSLLGGTESPVCVTMVLDEEQSLVTIAVSRIGFYPKRPRLAVVDITFGAIRVPGQPLPVKRHGYTRDLAGRKITWHYATGFINTQIYYTEKYCRIRPLTDLRTPEEIAGEEEEIRAGLRPAPMLYEEPMRVIRIKEGLYLLCFVEDNMNRVNPEIGGNNLMFAANLSRGCDYGRCFSIKNGKVEFGFFNAYSEPCEEDLPVEHEKSPYRV